MKEEIDIEHFLPDMESVIPKWVCNLSDDNPDIRKFAILSLASIFPQLLLDAFNILESVEIPERVKPYFPIDISTLDPYLFSHFTEISNNQKKVEYFFDSIFHFTGYLTGLERIIRSFDQHRLTDRFLLLLSQINQHRYKKQLMVALTFQCNLECPYCFSGSYKEMFAQELTMDNFVEILKWCSGNEIRIISFTGGEPSMHPSFGLFLRTAKEYGMECYFATNLIFGQEKLESIIRNKVDFITIHVNDEDSYTGAELDMLNHNLRALSESSSQLFFRYNISDDNKKKWQFIFDLAEHYRIYQINIALPFPDYKSVNYYIPSNELLGFNDLIIDFLLECNKRKLRGYLSKPLPICMFSIQQIRKLIMLESLVPICTIFRNDFTYNAVVYPDLKIAPCMALKPGSRAKLLEFRGLAEISKLFRDGLEKLLSAPFYEKCNQCSLFYTKQCQGGCLSYKIKN